MPNTIPTVAPVAPLLRPKRKKVEKAMELKDVNAESVKNMPDPELMNMHRRTHQLFFGNFGKSPDKQAAGNLTRDQIKTMHKMLADEMNRRGFHHQPLAPIEKSSKAKGISVRPPIGQRLMARSVRVLVMSQDHSDVVGKKVQIVQGDQALGEVTLKAPIKVESKDIQHLAKIYPLSDAERTAIAKEGVFAYPVVFGKKYDKPVPVQRAGKKKAKC